MSLLVCSLKQVRKFLTERLGSLRDFIKSRLCDVRTVPFSGMPTDLWRQHLAFNKWKFIYSNTKVMFHLIPVKLKLPVKSSGAFV